MTENNQNAEQKVQKEQKEKPKEYDGSKRPMLLVKHYKSLNAMTKAKERIDKRFAWIKKQSSKIQQDFDNPSTDALLKRDLLAENKKLASEVPELKKSKAELRTRYLELEKVAKDEIKDDSLVPINLD
ncbi:MAG: hypothetical protein HOF35_07790 [Bacteroidetes bacterium]|jgi:hypothetical protein|nr:hypothetical protein [Bacteroidota bacterium]MBT5529289.1 hypothetical protein [Cytophagia bacterium]